MGEKAEELVRGGNQYIAIDLTSLDYIYSDAINRFVNLNRTILDISGRIVIVAPHPKVLDLLNKAGVQNFIKVVDTEAELIKISEMLASRRTSASAPAPKNDFEDLQSALNNEPVQEPVTLAVPVRQAPVQQATPAPEPDTAFPRGVTGEIDTTSFDDENDNLSNSFEGSDDDEEFEKKKSHLGPIIAVVLVLIIIGVAGYFLMSGSTQSDQIIEDKTPLVAEKIKTEKIESEKSLETPEKSTITKTASKKRSSKKKSYSSKSKKTNNKKSSKPAKVTGDIIKILSNPAGADIIANGNFIGTTPFTWSSPSAYGDLRIIFRKSGYEEKEHTMEYLGGKKSVSANLIYNGGATPVSSTPATKNASNSGATAAARQATLAEQNRVKMEQSQQAEASQHAADLAKAEAIRIQMEAERINNVAAAEQAKKQRAEADAKKQQAEIAAAQKAEADKKAASNAVAAKAEASIYFNSLPPMADIYEGTKLIGKTNMKPIQTTTGSHTFTFKKGGKSAVTTVNLRTGRNNAPMIRLQ